MRRALSILLFLLSTNSYASYFTWHVVNMGVGRTKLTDERHLFELANGFKCEVSKLNHNLDKNYLGKPMVFEYRDLICKYGDFEVKAKAGCSTSEAYAPILDKIESLQVRNKNESQKKQWAWASIECDEKE